MKQLIKIYVEALPFWSYLYAIKTETVENEFKLATLNILKGNYTFSPARVMARIGNLSTTDQCSNLYGSDEC